MTAKITNRMTIEAAIGRFICNFGVLDWTMLLFLEKNLSKKAFTVLKKRHFADRIERIHKLVNQPHFSKVRRKEFEGWAKRLSPLRETRNLIAHGLISLKFDPDLKTWSIALESPLESVGDDESPARRITLDELITSANQVAQLIEDFHNWDGTWTTHTNPQGISNS